MRAPPSFLPTPTQREILRICLGDDDVDVRRRWGALRPHFDLDVMEPGTFELLPLAHQALTRAGVDDPYVPRLKGIVRRTWARNALQLERLRRTAEVLVEGDVRALFLHGAPFAARFYPEPSLRPTAINHVLVAPAAVERSVFRALRVGWARRPQVADGGDGRRVLFDDEGAALVVLPGLAPDFRDGTGAPMSDRLFERTESLVVGDGGTLEVPTASDALLSSIVTGARTSVVRDVQWIADVAQIARSATVDWHRVVTLAVEGGQALRLQLALRELAALGAVAPPAAAFDALDRAAVGRRDRWTHRATTSRPGPLGTLPALVGQHLAETKAQPLRRVLTAFPDRLQAHWELARVTDLPVAVGRRAARALTPRGRGAR